MIVAVVVGTTGGGYKAADADVAGTAGDIAVDLTNTVTVRVFMVLC